MFHLTINETNAKPHIQLTLKLKQIFIKTLPGLPQIELKKKS